MTALGLAGCGAGQDDPDQPPGFPEPSGRPISLERVFSAAAPNRLWLADLTYV